MYKLPCVLKYFLHGFLIIFVCLRSRFAIYNPERSEGLKILKPKTNKTNKNHNKKHIVPNNKTMCLDTIVLFNETLANMCL